MSAATIHIGPEFFATPSAIGDLTEEQARATFRAFMFAGTGGSPCCPKCMSTDVCEYKCRPIFKCKQCSWQFSLTSGTPFAYLKISFKKILKIIAYFNHAAHACTAHNLCIDLNLHYKTVFLWLHKIRSELSRVAHDIVLQDEVEVDGAWDGGKNRPTNSKKSPGDKRRSAWRHTHKRVQVVVARQRAGGPAITFITKTEGMACKAILAQCARDVVFFTDDGDWTGLDSHTRFPLIHDDTFCTPESCNNLAENYNTMFRYLGKAHKKTADRYLDLYAADVAWRLQHGKAATRRGKESRRRSQEARREGFASIMAAMCRNGRSELAGYFRRAKDGGSKRLCPIITDKEGSVGGWRQPTPEEWKAMRHGYRKEGEPPPAPLPFDTPSLKWARSDRWNQDFTFIAAEDFAKDPRSVPDRPGVYAILFDDHEAILAASGYSAEGSPPLWEEVGCGHLYTGEAYGLRSRLRQHLLAQDGPSNLRETLFAIQHRTGILPGVEVTLDREASEQSLTNWVLPRALIAFKVCGYVKEVEKAILVRAASPLNIRGRDARDHSRGLVEMRRDFTGYIDGHWAPIKPGRRPVRR